MNPSDMIDMFRRRGGSSCVEVGRHIQSYLDGRLDTANADKIARHLDVCRRCGLTASDYRDLKAALAERSMPVPAEPLARLRALVTALASGNQPPT